MPTATPRIRTTGLTPRHDAHTSPYPDSDSENTIDNRNTLPPSYTTTIRLRASIATVPESRLREIMVRLVDRSLGFQHAVAKELLASGSPTDHAPPSPRRKRRKSSRRSHDERERSRHRPCVCVNCGKQIRTDGGDQDAVCVYHPGRLEEEIYEFPTRTPEGRTFQVRRKIMMWSCCDEDARSPGCASGPGHLDVGAAAGSRMRVTGATATANVRGSSDVTGIGEAP
ncbi:hypothetical protein FPV67DRAFT_1778836 [Lyophyllum atratum]|nr:hypothetical protein FPV67DRAFT_1778836 [Lyophyllum atratum]